MEAGRPGRPLTPEGGGREDDGRRCIARACRSSRPAGEAGKERQAPADPVAGFFLADVDRRSPDARGLLAKGYELARPDVYDVKTRLEDQALDGIHAEVVHPSVILNLYRLADKEVLKAAFLTYDDWTAEHRAPAPGRLFPLACIQLDDLDDAVVEVERAKRLGHVGACIAATASPATRYTGACIAATADLIRSGVCQRFPRLRFVITELRGRLDRDHAPPARLVLHPRRGAKVVGIPEPPFHYWRQSFFVTVEDDDLAARTRDVIGPDTMLWGSDHPTGTRCSPAPRRPSTGSSKRAPRRSAWR